jgi:hypothetical protein
MSYELTTTKEGNLLHVKALGTRTFENVVSIIKDILQTCAEQGTHKVLVDVRALEGRLSIADAFEIPTSIFPQMRDRTILQKGAIVDLKEFEKGYKFFENVAVNRGFNIRIFPDIDEAIAWLKN